MKKDFTFIDLFSWIWWFHIGLKKIWWKCITSCEIDKYCREIYKNNFYYDNKELFDNGLFFEDIKKINTKIIPNFDILCWGFPCQAFSIAGKQKWFEDERGNLFFDLLKIIKDKNPKAIFLENVKNLQNHDGWKTFKIIIEELEKAGYFIKYKVLNTAEYANIPHNRERIFIIWFKNKKHFDNFKFPEKIKLNKTYLDFLENDNLIEEKYYYTSNSKIFNNIKNIIIDENKIYQWRRKYVRENKNNLVPTLTANMWTWWHNVPLIYRNKIWKIRKLTPRECFNLQWFPKNFKLDNISNWQLYKQAGNSVSIPIIKRIWEQIIKAMFKT